ncbi:MAG: hypothetical protein M1831_001840 [Alyxoria varia]|nr:MAG: hypothetical protein M1831_001840 [Alyxoria varia]
MATTSRQKRGPSTLARSESRSPPYSPPQSPAATAPTTGRTASRTMPKQRSSPPAHRPAMQQRSSTRLISVDNVLQYASEIPSGQRRGADTVGLSQRHHNRTPSGKHPLDPKLSGRMLPSRGAAGGAAAVAGPGGGLLQKQLPSRSTKVSEKLVLLPEAQTGDEEEDDDAGEYDDDRGSPPRDEELRRRKRKVPKGLKEKTYAERLPKASRTEKVSRVTAYCTAQAYKMKATADFVRTKHGAKTKLYDDCLYTVYHLPLLPGNDGYRIQSSPVLKSPGGKAVLDEEIERNERHEYREGFFGEEQYGVRGAPESEESEALRKERTPSDAEIHAPPPPQDSQGMQQDEDEEADGSRQEQRSPDIERHSPPEQLHPCGSVSSGEAVSPSEVVPTSPAEDEAVAVSARLAANLTTFAEMFTFSYGVVVFWNFTERQEKDILADLTFSSTRSRIPRSMPHQRPRSTSTGSIDSNATATDADPEEKSQSDYTVLGIPLAVRPLSEEDFETEDFHFEYNPSIPRPRLFNDMITLRSGDHMIKLAMSHAIAQSTKLSHFEERMAETMKAEAQYVPRRLALKGELGMRREEVVRILGRLFMSRVDVNLSSNMLDVPNFFWDSEPTLHPLYTAVREYLEIKPRIQVLNERCQVFLDLAEILSDSIADRKMSRLTWIIIILIVCSIVVTTGEVFLRFGILSAKKGGLGGGNAVVGSGSARSGTPVATKVVGYNGSGVGAGAGAGASGEQRVLGGLYVPGHVPLGR